MEQSVLIPRGRETLSGMLYQPDGEIRCGMVMCAPLFEERKSSHRVMVDAARTFAANGCAVLRFDYCGRGDSTGDFKNYSCPDWREDITCAARFMNGQTGLNRLGLLGLRLGASLAFEAARMNESFDFTVLWEPIIHGQRYFDYELRRKLIREMVTFGQSRVTRETLLKDLKDGQPIDLDGYAVTSRLFHDITTIDLIKAAAQGPRKVLLVHIAPSGAVPRELSALKEAGLDGGAHVDLISTEEDPFWNLVGLVECPSLIEKTKGWIILLTSNTGQPLNT
jgi:exosortase A-associated hydrolase 2